MGTILGDFFKQVGGGLGKVFDGDVVEGLGDVLGAPFETIGRTVESTLDLFGLDDSPSGPTVVSEETVPLDGVEEEGLDPLHRAILLEVATLAKMAKIDGIVDKREISFMNDLFDDWQMKGEARNFLIELFNEAKRDTDNIGECSREAAIAAAQAMPDDEGLSLRFQMYQHLFVMALADGQMHDAELDVLRHILPDALGLKDEVFDILAEAVSESADNTQALAEAYDILGVAPEDSDEVIRAAHRQKIAVFHPDTIEAKNLDPAWREVANRECARINEAYQLIRNARLGTLVSVPYFPALNPPIREAGDANSALGPCGAESRNADSADDSLKTQS